MLNLKLTPIDPKAAKLLDDARKWAETKPEISAIALAGSHAHGRARPDSDIDLVILSDSPDALRTSEWLSEFGDLSKVTTEQWGIMTCHRVWYLTHGEVEVGVAPSSWADIPVDSGTFRVVQDGVVVVHDPRGALKRLIEEVANPPHGGCFGKT